MSLMTPLLVSLHSPLPPHLNPQTVNAVFISVRQMATFQMTSVASGFGFISGIKDKGGEQQRKASLKGVDFVSGLEES